MPPKERDGYNLENPTFRRDCTPKETREMVEAMQHIGVRSRGVAILMAMKLFITEYGEKKRAKR